MARVKNTTAPKNVIIAELLRSLQWLRSKENAERMVDMRIGTSGIIRDAVMMCFDFARKQDVDTITLMGDILIGIAMNHQSKNEHDYFSKLFNQLEELSRKDENDRKS
jgi:hypothetical protein